MQNFFYEGDKNSDVFHEAVRNVCEGLIYISETDAPVVPYLGKVCNEVNAKEVIEQTGSDKNAPVEECTFQEFFERLTADRDWYGETDRARAKKFLELQKLLEECLSQRKVFRIGRVRLNIYAVGLDSEGLLCGVSTLAVET